MSTNNGGPAFPNLSMWSADRMEYSHEGMTLSDYFAAKAMQGICAGRDEAGQLIEHGYDWIAQESYRIADAMLKARES